jgi:hypothetical protein
VARKAALVADGGGGLAEPDFALIRLDQPGQDAQQGGLARAVDTATKADGG